MPKKKGGGFAALVPTSPATTDPSTATVDQPSLPVRPHGPRGGKTERKGKRAVAITFRITPAQYRKVSEARLDDGETMQDFAEKVFRDYFTRRGLKF